MKKRIASILCIFAVLVIGAFMNIASNGCPEGGRWVLCRDGVARHCCNEPCCPSEVNDFYYNLSDLPAPDLRYTNLDGLVDFRTTTLEVRTSDGDLINTKLKGRVSIKGGVCSGECGLELLYLDLESVEKNITTVKGRKVSKLFVRNLNSWQGIKKTNSSILVNENSKLGIEAIVDGKKNISEMNVSTLIEGRIDYNVLRSTGNETVPTNKITIVGNFSGSDAAAILTINIWATDCETIIRPVVECRYGIDRNDPAYVHFYANFSMLANLQSSQDICDALLESEYQNICSSGAGNEIIPSFACKKKELPPENNEIEMAKELKFTWKDGEGKTLSNQYIFNQYYVPVYPVSLTVENKWGKTTSAKVVKAPVCSATVPLAPGACAWVRLDKSESHGRSNSWCQDGAFLTALDLDGDPDFSPHDTPVVGHARCCLPKLKNPGWETCKWEEIGRKSHQRNSSWCENNAFLTSLDLDRDSELSSHDSPIVGGARCCTSKGVVSSYGSNECTWVEIGIRSHQRAGSWCPKGEYLTALDLDGKPSMDGADSPVVGHALCCPFPAAPQ